MSVALLRTSSRPNVFYIFFTLLTSDFVCTVVATDLLSCTRDALEDGSPLDDLNDRLSADTLLAWEPGEEPRRSELEL